MLLIASSTASTSTAAGSSFWLDPASLNADCRNGRLVATQALICYAVCRTHMQQLLALDGSSILMGMRLSSSRFVVEGRRGCNVAGRFEGEGAAMGWLGFRWKQRVEDRPARYHASEIGTRIVD